MINISHSNDERAFMEIFTFRNYLCSSIFEANFSSLALFVQKLATGGNVILSLPNCLVYIKYPNWNRVNIIISYIFPENSIEVPQVAQRISGLSLSVIAIFINFNHFFWIF